MDKQEAKQLLATKAAEYRQFAYADLAARVGEVECYSVNGPSGAEYQIEIQFLWDGKPGGNLRLVGSIDDGGLYAFVPLCDDLIVTPEGKYVDE